MSEHEGSQQSERFGLAMNFFQRKMTKKIDAVTKIQKGEVNVHHSIHERYRPLNYLRNCNRKLTKITKEVEEVKIEKDTFILDCPTLKV